MTDEDNTPSSPRELKSKQKQEWDDYISDLIDQGKIKPKTYITKGEAYDCWLRSLSTGDRAIPVLEYVAELRDKDDNWIDNIKSNRMHPDIVKAALRDFKNHPVSILMQDKGLVTASSKRAMLASQSVTGVLNALSDNVRVVNRIEELEKDVDTLKQAVIMLAVDHSHTQEVISDLKIDVEKLNKQQLIQTARQMKSEGLTYTQIAEKLGKTRQTVAKWIKENK